MFVLRKFSEKKLKKNSIWRTAYFSEGKMSSNKIYALLQVVEFYFMTTDFNYFTQNSTCSKFND